MINDIGATEWEPKNSAKSNYWVQKTSNPGHHQQHNTHRMSHDHQIMQGLTDGYVAVIGHHQQKEDLQPTKKCSVKSWVIKDWKDMVFIPTNKLEISLGDIDEE